MESVRILLSGAIDYAGLFPPAGLGMEQAVRNYAAYRSGPQAWALGRFVVPVARLEEFERAAGDLLPGGQADPCRLTVLAGANLAADIAAVEEFNRRHSPGSPGLAGIDAVELPASTREEVSKLARLVPSGLTVYFEIPVSSDLEAVLGAVFEAQARAKVRTGGIAPGGFPSGMYLARFLSACAAAGVPFKATAGLHHAVRGVYRLTSEANSASHVMHGFLNLLLAAALAWKGADDKLVAAVLDERSCDAFRFGDGGVVWRTARLENRLLAEARRSLVIAFGSCSFDEPLSELKHLGLL